MDGVDDNPSTLSIYAGCIQISEATHSLLGASHTFAPTGGVEVKGVVREGEGGYHLPVALWDAKGVQPILLTP